MRVTERTAGDLEELQGRVRREAKAIVRDRYRAVVMALEGKEAAEIAGVLGRARRSVQDWVYCYRDGGVDELLTGKHTGRRTKLPRERHPELVARLEAGPAESDGVCTLRGKDVVRILAQEFGVKYSLSGAYELLDRLGYSCLTPRPKHEKNDPAAIADFKARAPLLFRP